MLTKRCDECDGVFFSRSRVRGRFCSPACKQKAYRRRRRLSLSSFEEARFIDARRYGLKTKAAALADSVPGVTLGSELSPAFLPGQLELPLASAPESSD